MKKLVDVPVLIVGGGPVGLGLALDLAWRNNRSALVERDPRTGADMLAKANGLHERTMETCRRWGIRGELDRLVFPPDHPGDSVYCTAMTGHFIGRSVIPSANARPTPPQSPEKRQRCAQYDFDPLLARTVQALGLTDLLYATEFLGFEQDADGVTSRLRHLDSGETVEIRSHYLVGCDGAGSLVRRQLGIAFEGGMLDFSLSALIRIHDLAAHHPISDGERYIVVGTDGAWGTMTSVDGRDIWRFTIVGSQERLDPARYDIAADIRRAIGRDDVRFDVLRVIPWRRSQCVAASYRSGRVLLAGDAAHTTSPTGGHGMNTGLADAMDLSWMLDALLAGWGGNGLLDAYDLERRPVGARNSAASAHNYQGWIEKAGYAAILDDTPTGAACRAEVGQRLVESLHGEWNSLGVDLGYRYEGSPIIIADGTPAPPDDASDYVQSARPGHRAPHGWLGDGRSTLDLFGRGFTLLRFGEVPGDVEPLRHAAFQAGLPLRIVDIQEAEVARLYARRLVLVRPDGQVAWRGDALPRDVHAMVDRVRGAIAIGDKLPENVPAAEESGALAGTGITIPA